MTNMGRHGNVDLRGNPLSPHAVARLANLRPNYSGATVRYTSQHHGRPLNIALRPMPQANSRLMPTRDQNGTMMDRILAALPDQLADQLLQMREDAEAAGNPISPEQLLGIAIEHMTFGRTIAEATHAITNNTHSLNRAVAAWLPPHTNMASSSNSWNTFGSEPGAAQFAQFLNRLRETVNANDPAFQRSVARWLTQLEADPSLRESTFATSVGATESCEDRISLTYNTMRKLSMAAEVSSGKYDQRLPELLTLARGMFRLEQLEHIARETTAELVQARGGHPVDEIEVYLGYQVMLRDPLALPVETSSMAFFRCSGLTQQHLYQAQARVQQAERTEFANYLSTNFTPWREVIQRLAPQLHEQAQDQLIEAMGDEFNRRLDQQLKALRLLNDPDAEREIGVQVLKQIEQEVYGQLTLDFLASQRMLNLLG